LNGRGSLVKKARLAAALTPFWVQDKLLVVFEGKNFAQTRPIPRIAPKNPVSTGNSRTAHEGGA
jgi:hypothetical protein